VIRHPFPPNNAQEQANELATALEELAQALQDAYGPIRARTLLLLGVRLLLHHAEVLQESFSPEQRKLNPRH
jgi:hypothetical protein